MTRGDRVGASHRHESTAGASDAGEGQATIMAAMRAHIEAAGYFPELVEDAVRLAIGDENLLDFVVHHQPTFTMDEVHRHITVVARTPTRLVVGHTDDYPAEDEPGAQRPDESAKTPVLASTSTEAVPLHRVTAVSLTRVVPHPERFTSADTVETWLSITWGAMRRVDLEPATCGDPECEADHGYTGALVADDLTMRMSVAADGAESVHRLVSFGTALQQVAGR